MEPDGQQDELGHTLQAKNTNNGSLIANGKIYYWRDAWGSDDAYFSYKLKVDEGENYLYVQYWGNDSSFASTGKLYTRHFNILIDDVKIAEQILDRENPGKPYHVFYKIPSPLTNEKKSVTVKFLVNNSDSCAGGVNEVRMMSSTIEE